jgi:hypothetical protein
MRLTQIFQRKSIWPYEILPTKKGLDHYWFNSGPSDLVKDLPVDWKNNIQKIYSGGSLVLYTLGRLDLIRSKIWALCDRQIDLGDCIALNPTNNELAEVVDWLNPLDGNPDWPRHVAEVVKQLKKELDNA